MQVACMKMLSLVADNYERIALAPSGWSCYAGGRQGQKVTRCASRNLKHHGMSLIYSGVVTWRWRECGVRVECLPVFRVKTRWPLRCSKVSHVLESHISEPQITIISHTHIASFCNIVK